MTTVKELLDDGYKVRVCHKRNLFWHLLSDEGSHVRLGCANRRLFESSSFFKEWSCTWGDAVLACGGRTIVTVDSPDGMMKVSGKSECSLQDNYNKKIGVSIALGRAIKAMEKVKVVG